MPATPGRPGDRLIDLRSKISSPIRRGIFSVVEKPLESVLSISAVNQIFASSQGQSEEPGFFSSVLRTLNVTYDLAPEDLAKIPASGPLVVVANHPFGAVDGLVLGDILTRIRPDARLLCNHLLARIPGLRPWIIPVNPFGGSTAIQYNFTPLRMAMKWLKQGGALGIFPAGTVSHLQLAQGAIVDPPWNASVAALVRRTGATVATLFFDGRNSMVFQLSGLIHPALRTALLPSELIKRRNSQLTVRIGRPIPPHKVSRYPEDRTLTEYLRFKTYMLKWRDCPVRPRFSPGAAELRPLEKLAEPVSPTALAREVANLPADAELVRRCEYQVFLARAQDIPRTLYEIGRLREATFRQVQEGTGRALDLDKFDQHYLHLFLWNHAKREIVGSYRIGLVDMIMARHGQAGLYTSTLFKFAPSFLQRIGPALEMGRSFIRREYQGRASPLVLLWRGIGEYLVRNARYKVLFGPVSISRSYEGLSRRLMLEFFERHCVPSPLAALVKARNPPKDKLARSERISLAGLVRDADDISALVSDIETDQKGVPVLLQHYLRLNASLLSFNVDPAFGNCIDGLVVVDLRTSDPKLLKRFMGDEGYTRFMSAPGSPAVLSYNRA